MKRKSASPNEDLSKKKKLNASTILPSHEEQKLLQQFDTSGSNQLLLSTQSSELVDTLSTRTESFISSQQLNSWVDGFKRDLNSSSKNSCHGRVISCDWVLKQHFHSTLGSFRNSEVEIEYNNPSNIEVVGSYATATLTPPFYNVDLLVTIPLGVIEERDILDHRYFDKRRLYLAGIWKTLEICDKKREEKLYKLIHSSLFKHDERKPIIEVTPHFCESILIRIIPIPADGSLKMIQLRNVKNNVRPQHWKEEVKRQDCKDLDISQLPPTPYYNMAILEDFVLAVHHRLVMKMVNQFPNIRKAITLFKVWSGQRDIRFTVDGFDSHHTSLLLSFLLQEERISAYADPFSIFKSLLTFLSTITFESSVLDFSNSLFEQGKEDFLRFFSLNLVHPVANHLSGSSSSSLFYNVWWRVTSSAMQHLQFECRNSLSLMTESVSILNENIFDQLFLRKSPFHLAYDQYHQVTIPAACFSRLGDPKFSLHVPLHLIAIERLRSLLLLGLNNRIRVCNCLVERPAAEKQSFDSLVITVGMILDLEHCERKVDRSIQFNSQLTSELQSRCDKYLTKDLAAVSFRDLWGEKCQLRRFKDGEISDAVVWEGEDLTGHANWIIDKIIRYLTTLHFGLNQEKVQSLPDSLGLPHSLLKEVSGFQSLMNSFDSLKKTLTTEVTQLPLIIETLHPISPEFRQTKDVSTAEKPLLELLSSHLQQGKSKGASNFSGIAKCSRAITPLVVFCEFESSGKWPQTPEAIDMCKRALLLKLKTILSSQFKVASVLQDLSLDVVWEGFVFRLVPFAGIETEKISSSQETSPGVVDGALLESINKRSWLIPPAHHRAIKAIQVEHAVYPKIVDFLKTWLACHYLSDHLSHEVVELLVAREFLDPKRKDVPSTPLAGDCFTA